MKKRIWVASALALSSLALLAYGLAHPTVTIRLDRAEVQRRIDAKLPLEGTRFGVAYSVPSAAVDLRPDGRIGVVADVTASALTRRADLWLAGSGVVAYRDGAFFLTAFKVERAVPKAVDEPLAEEDPAPRGRLFGAIERLGLKDRAAHALEASGVRDGAAFLVARKEAVIAVAREKGEALLVDALERHPVYRLKEGDVRQSLARLALQDVRVEDGTLLVDLNVMRALARILLYGVALVLAVAAAAMLVAAFGLVPGLGIGAALSFLD